MKEPTMLGVNMFPATSNFETHHGYIPVLGSHTNCQFHPFPSERVLVLATLHRYPLILPFLEHLANRNRWQTKELHIYVCVCPGMPLLARAHYYCAKYMTVRGNQTCPSRALPALLFAWLKKKTPLFCCKQQMYCCNQRFQTVFFNIC